MLGEGRESEGHPKGEESPPSPSPLIQLELEILAADVASGAVTPHGPAVPDDRAAPHDDISIAPSGPIVLVLTSDLFLSRYIEECLRQRTDLRIKIADLASAQAAASESRAVVIVDAGHFGLLGRLRDSPALLIVDEPSEREKAAFTHRAARLTLVRPFNARSLLAQVDRLLRR